MKPHEIKQALKQVQDVHKCPSCLEHLKAIKEHRERDHQ